MERRIWRFFLAIFLIFFFWGCGGQGHVEGEVWGGEDEGEVIRVRAIPMSRGYVVRSVFPLPKPSAHAQVTAKKSQHGGPPHGISEALVLTLLLPPCCLMPLCFVRNVLPQSEQPARPGPSDRHPHVFVRSWGCDLCLEWTEPLAPQKSCLLGEK